MLQAKAAADEASVLRLEYKSCVFPDLISPPANSSREANSGLWKMEDEGAAA